MKKINNIPIEIKGKKISLVDALFTIVGTEGSRLNPVQDINGDWFISEEEWNCDEFAEFKIANELILPCFEDAEFKPVPPPSKLG